MICLGTKGLICDSVQPKSAFGGAGLPSRAVPRIRTRQEPRATLANHSSFKRR